MFILYKPQDSVNICSPKGTNDSYKWQNKQVLKTKLFNLRLMFVQNICFLTCQPIVDLSNAPVHHFISYNHSSIHVYIHISIRMVVKISCIVIICSIKYLGIKIKFSEARTRSKKIHPSPDQFFFIGLNLVRAWLKKWVFSRISPEPVPKVPSPKNLERNLDPK